MGKWQRSFYQPVLPLGEDGRKVTGSKEHIALSRMAAGEGMVLLKNEKNTLPIRKGTKVALFGKGTVDYVKGGGGSGDVTVEYIRNLYEGMKIKEDEGKVEVFDKLAKYYEENIRRRRSTWHDCGTGDSGRSSAGSKSIHRYCGYYNLPFLRGRLGSKM